MFDLENIEYLLATDTKATLAFIGVVGLGIVLVVAPLLTVLFPVFKMVATLSLQGI